MARRFMCGTPHQFCTGTKTMCNAALGKQFQQKTHTGRAEAFKCHKRWLINHEGYEAVEDSSRELRSTTGGARLVLTKISHFGQELRSGKSGERGKGGIRFMPKNIGQSGALI